MREAAPTADGGIPGSGRLAAAPRAPPLASRRWRLRQRWRSRAHSTRLAVVLFTFQLVWVTLGALVFLFHLVLWALLPAGMPLRSPPTPPTPPRPRW